MLLTWGEHISWKQVLSWILQQCPWFGPVVAPFPKNDGMTTVPVRREELLWCPCCCLATKDIAYFYSFFFFKKKQTLHSNRSYTNRTMCKISQGEANAKRVISAHFVCKDKGFCCCQVSRIRLDTTAHFAINLVFTWNDAVFVCLVLWMLVFDPASGVAPLWN